MSEIILKPGKKLFRNKHPYLFSGAVKKIIGNPREGEIVKIKDIQGSNSGNAFWIGGKSLKAALFDFEDKYSENFWQERLQKLWELKKSLPHIRQSEAFRLVFGESDGIPGLVIDIYKDTAVLQYKMKAPELLEEEWKKFLLNKKIPNIVIKEGQKTRTLVGEARNVLFQEGDIKFIADIAGGQKTGFFLDQVLNRKRFAEYVWDKKVANVFSYTGAFSLAALSAGASHVVSIDASERALAILEENLKHNSFYGKHKSLLSDAFKFLKEVPVGDFDIIVLDPPAFSKHKNTLITALRAYQRLNKLAMERLLPGGLLFTFSCSRVVSESAFRKMIFKASIEANKEIRILEKFTQAPDHTLNPYFPEGEYLKGLALQIL